MLHLMQRMSAFTMSGTKRDSDAKDDFKRQGSFRKILPANDNGDSQLSMSVKMIDRPNISQNNKEYMVYIQEYNILAEYNILCNENLYGIYVIPSAQNSFLWFGVQFVRQGIYQGGVFRFTITLSQNFPDGGCPIVVFQSNVFHPLIHPESGKLYTQWGFPDWKKNTRISQLVQYITKVLIKVDTKMPAINEEASFLLETNFEHFQERAKKCVKDSLNEIFNAPVIDDPHYITFSHYNPELHDQIKKEIYSPQVIALSLLLKEVEETKNMGYSWVKSGSLEAFSKTESR